MDFTALSAKRWHACLSNILARPIYYLDSSACGFARQRSSETAQLRWFMPIRSGAFLIDVFQDSGSNRRRQSGLFQHSVDDCRRNAYPLMIGLKNAPGRAAR